MMWLTVLARENQPAGGSNSKLKSINFLFVHLIPTTNCDDIRDKAFALLCDKYTFFIKFYNELTAHVGSLIVSLPRINSW